MHSRLQFRIPTYVGAKAAPAATGHRDFADPIAAIYVSADHNLFIELSPTVGDERIPPNIQIERRPQGWAIHLHPLANSDPSGTVFFLDDGRSFLVIEPGEGPTRPLLVLQGDEDAPALDPIDRPEELR